MSERRKCAAHNGTGRDPLSWVDGGRSDAGMDRILELVGLVYDAALDPATWPEALNMLADGTGADLGSTGAANFAGDKFGAVAPRHEPEFLRRYAGADAARHNLHWQRSGSAPCGQTFAAETLVPRDEFGRTADYREWVTPHEMESAPGVNLLAKDSTSTVASVNCPFRLGAFGAPETPLFSALLPHMQRAVELQHRLAELEMQRASWAAGFDRLRDGVVIVDSNFGIVFANRSAGELLADGDGLILDHDGIAAGTPGDTAALRRLIAGPPNGNGLPGAGGRCTLGRRNGCTPLSVLAVPLHGEVAWIVPRRPAAVLFVTDPDRDGRASTEALRRRFRLTRAEAAFLGEIVKGDGLRAAADRLGVSLATARTHLRHVFEKTGTQRQAELVGLMVLGRTTLRDEP
jgi:DNA-binding CsgD family transcriptional regulator/PAS domain-containing protein